MAVSLCPRLCSVAARRCSTAADTLGPLGQRIYDKLTSAYPGDVSVSCESWMHDVSPGAEKHFAVELRCDAFHNKSRLQRHRMVHRTLADELAAGVHALRIAACAPHEESVATEAPPCAGTMPPPP